MKFQDLTKMFRKYKNKWLALMDDNTIIASGNSLPLVLKKAKEKGIETPVTFKVPDTKYEFVL